MSPEDSPQWKQALALMEGPIWPLVELVKMLYLAGGYQDIDLLFSQLPDPIEMEHATYNNPVERLAPYKEMISAFFSANDLDVTIKDEMGEILDPLMAKESLLRQKIIEQELETINSLLCTPMGCDLCCIGPTPQEKNLFFEIPISEEELDLFQVEKISTDASRSSLSAHEPPLTIGGREFYRCGPCVIEWMSGHSLILPRGTRCPQLNDNGRCLIYNERPKTCRKPQIFAYVVEKDSKLGNFTFRNKMLAILDCPYVKILKNKIYLYASLCNLDLVVSPNRK